MAKAHPQGIQITFHELVINDKFKLYVGGGNASKFDDHLDSSVTIVGKIAGILGDIKLWNLPDE